MYVSGVQGGGVCAWEGEEWPRGRQLTGSMTGIHLLCSFKSHKCWLTFLVIGCPLPALLSFIPESRFLALHIFLIWPYLGPFSSLSLVPRFQHSCRFDVPGWTSCSRRASPAHGTSPQGTLGHLSWGTSHSVSFVPTRLFFLLPSCKAQCNPVWNETITRILHPSKLLIIRNKDKLPRLESPLTFSSFLVPYSISPNPMSGSQIRALAFSLQSHQ